MLAFMFAELLGEYFLLILANLLITLPASLRESADSPVDPDDLTFIKEADFMFPENFLSRYPHEANAYRLKIFSYLIFNLLVKGHGSVDPEKVWLNYNRGDYNRVLIDAVFYEYLSNYTDSQNKDFAFNVSESIMSPFPLSTEEIAVDRIGQYLDTLSESESNTVKLSDTHEILSELQTPECEMQTLFQSSGTPGIDYPDFCDIPETSFTCDGKRIPGIYADFETGCQVFHVCWPHRIDSFLCPIGTIFNQSLLTCNIWHDVGCYSSPLFTNRDQFLIDGISTELDVPEYDGTCESLLNKPLLLNIKYLPAKCQVVDVEEIKQAAKSDEKDVDEFRMRLETAYDLVREMLNILREIRKELADEMRNRGAPWVHVLAKRLESRSVPKTSTEKMDDTSEFTRKLGEAGFKPLRTAEQVTHSGKISSGTRPSRSVTRSTLLKPSKSLEEHIKSSREQNVPEIVMESLRMGGNILNEGLIPLTKQVIMDSYRKIESKKH